MNNVSIVDRKGSPVQEGLRVRVQHCIGRYGQVQIVEGVVKTLTEGLGAILVLEKAARQRRNDHFVTLEPGRQLYVCLPGRLEGKSRYVCDFKHEDFEHGHEAWVEVIH